MSLFDAAFDRIIALEAELERAANALQKIHPIGEVKAIGLREVGQVAEEVAELYGKLKRFKEYVHGRLDAAGVPADPESVHKNGGCRIGGRLDLVLAHWPKPQSLAELLSEMVADDDNEWEYK